MLWKRATSLLVAGGLAVALAGYAPPRWGVASTPRVDVYGDSVTWESQVSVIGAIARHAQLYLRVYPGTGILSWLPDMRQTAPSKPDIVLIVFGANWPLPGRHTDDVVREYQDDAATASDIFAGSRVLLGTDPQARFGTDMRRMDAAYRAVAATRASHVAVYTPSLSVAPDWTFTESLPCLPGETVAMGCTRTSGGVIKVRSPDGVHLCPVRTSTTCPVYSSGARRFGAAVIQPAVDAHPARPVDWGVTRVPYGGVVGDPGP
jgi:hypothetical protein